MQAGWSGIPRSPIAWVMAWRKTTSIFIYDDNSFVILNIPFPREFYRLVDIYTLNLLHN